MSDNYSEVRSIPLPRILDALGINSFKKRKGKEEWFGRCPVHKPEKNATSFSFTQEKFHCFSCGAKGAGAIDLVKALRSCSFTEAVEWLKSLGIQEEGVNKPFNGNYEKYYVESEWLLSRFRQETLDFYGVGQYCNPARQSRYTNQVLFPIRRFADGEKVGYLARNISGEDGQPKYVFPPRFSKHLELFGAWQIRESDVGQARPARIHQLGYVVESPLTVLHLHEQGIRAVAPFGAFLSSEQVEMLAQLFRGVVFLPDRDKYDTPSVWAQLGLLAQKVWVRSPRLPEGVLKPRLTASELQALL